MPAWDRTGATEAGDMYDDDEAVVASPRADEFVVPPPVDIPIAGGGCSADEVWDDSFLVDVWNAAEQEYLDFHRRRRESIDAILAERDTPWHRLGAVAADEGDGTRPETHTAAGVPSLSPMRGAATPGWHAAQAIVAAAPPTPYDTHQLDAHTQLPQPSVSLPPELPRSEALQNLVMAWYYTGYYTAKYEAEHDGRARGA